MDDLSGSGQALPLAGDAFMGTWEGQSVSDLMGLIHDTMPQDKPGTLTPDQTLTQSRICFSTTNFLSERKN